MLFFDYHSRLSDLGRTLQSKLENRWRTGQQTRQTSTYKDEGTNWLLVVRRRARAMDVARYRL
jgi:hypothetical protein